MQRISDQRRFAQRKRFYRYEISEVNISMMLQSSPWLHSFLDLALDSSGSLLGSKVIFLKLAENFSVSYKLADSEISKGWKTERKEKLTGGYKLFRLHDSKRELCFQFWGVVVHDALIFDKFEINISEATDEIRLVSAQLTRPNKLPIFRQSTLAYHDVVDSVQYGLCSWTSHRRLMMVGKLAEAYENRAAELPDEDLLTFYDAANRCDNLQGDADVRQCDLIGEQGRRDRRPAIGATTPASPSPPSPGTQSRPTPHCYITPVKKARTSTPTRVGLQTPATSSSTPRGPLSTSSSTQSRLVEVKVENHVISISSGSEPELPLHQPSQ